jgi:hypothetical protein
MCENCYVLKELFKAAESNSHQNYIPALAFIKEMVNQRRIECPLEEVEKYLSEEIHYTIRHFFRCRSCQQYFFIGACIRGMPVYEVIDKISKVNIDNMWGKYGILYK